MENPEEVLQTLDEFTKLKPKEIPKELEDYLSYVAKTGDPVYQWSLVKCLFREKLLNVITEFYEGCPSVDLPPCPNVDTFNYEIMKNCLIERLESFASAPFTVQRLCELLTSPKKQYSRADKFMRAVEKNILVVSTREPGQARRAESSQPELVNGVTDSTGNEPSRVGLALAEAVGSSTSVPSGSFLNTEGAVQVIFEDGSLGKNHTKCYEDGYEDGVPRRSTGWFRERLESPDKITSFGSQIHSHVTARMGEESNVDVGNQLAEKYRGTVSDRGIVEDDEEEDYIEDDYVEPTQNVQSFQSQDANPSTLDLEGAEDYCSPPSPEEESSETSAAVSTIAEENSTSVSETSPLKEGEPTQAGLATPLPSEISQNVQSSESKSEALTSDDLKTKDVESVHLETSSIDIVEEQLPSSIVTNNETASVAGTSNIAIVVSESSEVSNTASACMEADGEEAQSNDHKNGRLEPAIVDSAETEHVEPSGISKCPSPKSITEETLEPEVAMSAETLATSIEEEAGLSADTDSLVIVEKSVTIQEVEHLKPESNAAEISVVDNLKSIVSIGSPKANVPENSVNDELESSCHKMLSGASPESAVSAILNDAEELSEAPIKILEAAAVESNSEVSTETPEIVTSLEEERGREMMIQNERIESVIQENVEQAAIPLQEEILMQQIFVPHETPMDEKTSEAEPEAMEVDETSQTVEEPMEQGDVSPTTIS